MSRGAAVQQYPYKLGGVFMAHWAVNRKLGRMIAVVASPIAKRSVNCRSGG